MPSSVEHDGGCEKGEYVFCSVSNTKRIGGGIVSFEEGQVVLDDGCYELLLVRKPPNFFMTMAVLFSVMMRRPMEKYVELHHTSFARIVFADSVSVCIDGEQGGRHESLDIIIEPKRIPVLVHS